MIGQAGNRAPAPEVGFFELDRSAYQLLPKGGGCIETVVCRAGRTPWGTSLLEARGVFAVRKFCCVLRYGYMTDWPFVSVTTL